MDATVPVAWPMRSPNAEVKSDRSVRGALNVTGVLLLMYRPPTRNSSAWAVVVVAVDVNVPPPPELVPWLAVLSRIELVAIPDASVMARLMSLDALDVNLTQWVVPPVIFGADEICPFISVPLVRLTSFDHVLLFSSVIVSVGAAPFALAENANKAFPLVVVESNVTSSVVLDAAVPVLC